ncbi:hypothetical protein Halru_1847 [Halovivax ruber XH-70]|uniref:Domain of unknown function domain-containing protein n=1 Tax=Halovivax ruber (strain DSM 18193 / JCM 13892 / XH-70) TaxID=797302 RepID=L0IE04_HALRX|nr:hypothetical protein [Halovivax ruber]AGB16446.1 hypothetical protein Halru_1847 [Halovivax ruber XH-70]
MVYSPEIDEMDRPRGILSQADREYLISDKSGYSHQAQHKRKKAIKERITNALLDIALIENHLDKELREEVFTPFDTTNVFNENIELYSSEEHYTSVFSNMIAFLYRETKEETGFNPSFSTSLENGIVSGEFEPGTAYYGPHNVDIDITFDKLPERRINVKSITERAKRDGPKTLNEGEMTSVIGILARSDSVNPEELQDEFQEWVEEFEEENERSPASMAEIFSQLDHGTPFSYNFGPTEEETE